MELFVIALVVSDEGSNWKWMALYTEPEPLELSSQISVTNTVCNLLPINQSNC